MYLDFLSFSDDPTLRIMMGACMHVCVYQCIAKVEKLPQEAKIYYTFAKHYYFFCVLSYFLCIQHVQVSQYYFKISSNVLQDDRKNKIRKKSIIIPCKFEKKNSDCYYFSLFVEELQCDTFASRNIFCVSTEEKLHFIITRHEPHQTQVILPPLIP